MPWLTPETKKPGGLEPTGPYSLSSPAVPLAFAYQGQTSEPASPLKGAWMVSAFYRTCHSGSSAPENQPENAPASPLFLTANGSRESHAVILSDGKQNRSRHAGRPYRGISWGEILKRIDEPTAVEKNDAPFVIPSTYRESEGRTHAVQRERGEFWFLAIDIDAGSPSLEQVVAAVAAVTGGARAAFYSSSSAAPGKLKWRGLIPLAAPVSGADYADTQTALFDLLKHHGIVCDSTLSRAAQPVYLPNVPPARRGPDGRPLFYRSLQVDGHLLDLAAGHRIVEARDALRATRERAAADRAARSAAAAARRQAQIDAGETITDAAELFRRNNPLDDCFRVYGFKNKPGTDDWNSPLSKSGSYSTRNMGGYWVTVSAWAKDHNVGRETKNGNFCGDAFDLFVHFEHGGDRRAAVAAYLVELGLRADPLDDVVPVILEQMPDRGPAREITGWRQQVAVERALALRMPGLHLDRSPTGSGKTYATTRAIIDAIRKTQLEAKHDDSVVPITRTLTVLPDHANIRERVREMLEAGLDAAAYPARDETTCGNLEPVRRAEGMGVTAGAAVCPVCTLRDACLYNQQLKQAEKADHAVATHERLRLSPGSLTKDRQVIVIDETPEAVLAPMLSVMIDDFSPVVALASTVRDEFLWRNGRPLEPSPDERAFAALLTDTYGMLVDAAKNATEPGVVEIPLPPPAEVPKDWQKTLLRWAVEVGVNPGRTRQKRERFKKAVRLLTMIVTGKIERLRIVVSETNRHEKQADGTVREWENLHHFVVGLWRTKLPNVPIICLDATATADDLRAATGREVRDCTPEGYLPNVAPVVQIPRAIDQTISNRTVAGHIADWLNAHPEFKQVGLIGIQDHVRAIMDDDRLLPPHLKARIAMSSYYYSGVDRASNLWFKVCDCQLLVGTPYPGGGPVCERLVSHGKEDAARRDGDWGVRHWEATTTDGRQIVVEGRGYRDPDWHAAHVGLVRATMLQGGGRARSILDTGKPVFILSDEPVAGAVVDDSVETSTWADREAVEAVRAVREGEPGTSLFPIRDTYRKKSGSQTLVRVSAVVEHMRAVAARDGGRLTPSGAEKRLRDARRHGRLVAPEKGWLAVAGDEPAATPAARPTVTVGRTEPATVISATGPAVAAPALEVAALPTPETTTIISTAATPNSPAPLVMALVEEADERAAIMEFEGNLDHETAERLAGEMLMGRGVISPVAPSEPVGVDHAALAARMHPFVDAAIRKFGGTVRLLSPEEDPFSTGWGVRATAAARPPDAVCGCGSSGWIDVPIHGGESIRRDCARCDKFICHVRWHGKNCELPPVFRPAAIPPPQPDERPTNRLSFLSPLPAAALVGVE